MAGAAFPKARSSNASRCALRARAAGDEGACRSTCRRPAELRAAAATTAGDRAGPQRRLPKRPGNSSRWRSNGSTASRAMASSIAARGPNGEDISCIWKRCATAGSATCSRASGWRRGSPQGRKGLTAVEVRLPSTEAPALAAFALAAALAACAPNRRSAERALERSPAGLEQVPLTIRSASGKPTASSSRSRARREEQAQGPDVPPVAGPDRGMIFPYDPPQPAAFWMKNTLIPLDIIFIRPDGTIARIAANTVPLSLETGAVGRAGRARCWKSPAGARPSWASRPATGRVAALSLAAACARTRDAAKARGDGILVANLHLVERRDMGHVAVHPPPRRGGRPRRGRQHLFPSTARTRRAAG